MSRPLKAESAAIASARSSDKSGEKVYAVFGPVADVRTVCHFVDGGAIMSDGHGCDAGGHFCNGASANAGGGDSGFGVGTDGRTPVPNLKRLSVNGAPIVESSHEYVIASPEKRLGR